MMTGLHAELQFCLENRLREWRPTRLTDAIIRRSLERIDPLSADYRLCRTLVRDSHGNYRCCHNFPPSGETICVNHSGRDRSRQRATAKV